MTKRYSLRALGLSAAIIVGAGGSIAASPAFAAKPAAPTAGPAYEEFSDDLLAKNAAAVGPAADGKVLVMVDTSDKASAKELEKLDTEYSNIKIMKLDGPIQPVSDRDVVGGAGYYSNNTNNPGEFASGCSFGFAGWGPNGEESVITAGHCHSTARATNKYVAVSDPKKDNDGTGSFNPGELHQGEMFGEFAFSQWGGKKDKYANEDDPTVTDIAAIRKTNDKYNLKPEVTDWTTQSSGDLSQSTTKITSVQSVTEDMAVKRSGRTTGNTSGKTLTDANLKFGVNDDPDGDGPQPAKTRYVTGFAATNFMLPGDSGGAWYTESGAAVGISSAIVLAEGGEQISFVTDIVHGLEQTDGYQVRLFVEAPTIENVTVKPGDTVSGTTEEDATAVLTDGPGDGFTAEAGKFSFTAPKEAGEYKYTFVAKKGEYNISEPTTVTVTVEGDPSPSPTATDDPTSTPSPTATEDPSDDPAERALSIDPENIKATDFVKKNAVQIAATGCTPGTEANLEVKPRGSNVTGHTDTATVDNDGNVAFSVYGENSDTPNAYIGDYDVTVSCDGGDDLTGSFTVTKTGGKDEDGKGGDDKNLPRTGSEALGSLGAAAALIAGGAGLYVLARRRKN